MVAAGTSARSRQDRAVLTAIAAVLVIVAASDGDALNVRDSATDAKTIVRLAEVDALERTPS